VINKPWLKHYDQGVPAEFTVPDGPAFLFLQEKARSVPGKTCAIYQDQSYTYQQIDQLSDRLAVSLKRLGIKKGDRISISLPNIPQFLVAFFGILKAGGIVVALNPHFKEDEVLYRINDSGVVCVICFAAALPLFRSCLGATTLTQIILTQTEDAANLTGLRQERSDEAGIYWLSTLLQSNQPEPISAYHISPEDAAVFQYSGGTTGVPKAVVATHRNLVANTIQNNLWLDPLRSTHEVMLVAIPLFHVFGMISALMAGISGGDALVLMPNPRDMAGILQSIARHKVTLFTGVPQLFNGLLQYLENSPANIDLSSLKLCISGSAPLPVSLAARFEKRTGARIVEGYGLSEAPTSTTINPVVSGNRAGSIGLPLPGIECRILSVEDGQSDVEPGGCGELVVKGPHVMAGYYNRPEENRQSLREGWLFTGDVAYMDADGYFYLVDRKKDLIKVGGFQVWPREVEDAIMEHPAVIEAGVAGIMNPEFGETIKAWVVIRPGFSITAEEVIAWCKSKQAGYKAPRVVEFVTSLPRNSMGKLLRRELHQLHS
jgi:long-chain acyl-CoA synthetase